MSLLRQFDSYRIVHVRREFNKLADRMANRDIDEAVKKAILRAKVDQAIALRAHRMKRGKSGLHRTGWPLTTAPSDRGKVPQKMIPPAASAAGKVEMAR